MMSPDHFLKKAIPFSGDQGWSTFWIFLSKADLLVIGQMLLSAQALAKFSIGDRQPYVSVLVPANETSSESESRFDFAELTIFADEEILVDYSFDVDDKISVATTLDDLKGYINA